MDMDLDAVMKASSRHLAAGLFGYVIDRDVWEVPLP